MQIPRQKSTPRDAAHSYRQIINSARAFAIVSTDLHGTVTSWSEGACRVFGWTEDEMLGASIDRIFLPEERAAGVPDQERQRALMHAFANDERWHLRKNGERFWAIGEMTPLADETGAVTGFVKALRDRTSEKHVEERLRSLNERLEQLVADRTRERDRLWRNSLDLLLVIDAGGVLRAVSPAWSSALGYRMEDLVDRPFTSFVHPDDAQATRAAIHHAARTPLTHFEVRMRHREGHYLWFAWTAAPEAGLIYANGRDITTEKRQAEQLLMANEARLRLALEAGEMGAWEWDMRSGELLMLHGADRLHGLERSDEVRRLASMDDYLMLVHPEDRKRVAAVLDRARNAGTTSRTEYRIVRADGSVQWVEARGTVYTDDSGRPARMTGVSVNITRRKRVEQDLQFLARASAELASLVDPQSTLDKLATLSVPTFCDWCAVDLREDDGVLRRVAIAHADPEKATIARDFYRRYRSDPKQSIGAWAVLRSGRPRLVREVSAEALDKNIADPGYRALLHEVGLRSYIGVPLAAHGRIMGVVTFVSAESGRLYDQADLELAADLGRRAAVAIENARLYRTLQESDRGKDVFIATLAHELRNPLAAISNGLGILRIAPQDAQRVAHSTDIMERQVAQLRRLVDDLMDASRIATGKIALRKEATSLVSIITSAVETTRPLIEAAHHKLSITLPGEPMRLYADPVRLAQVFANLLNNAAKYTNEGGRIDVSMETQPDQFVVRVRDTGIGIPPDLLKGIFTIFKQGSHPLERSHGGLGIGLSLVDGLVRMHGGHVEASSAGPNQGSEFVVCLPRTEPPNPDAGANQDANQEAPAPGGSVGRRILVVDDNVDAANTVAELLRLLGHEVSVEHDGLAAVNAAARLQPDIVLMDIGLPGIDGYEAGRRIRSQEGVRKIKLVALTGWGQEQDKERAYQAGFDQHCVKPIGLEQLRALVSG